ncbi:hypothetical protein, partial [Listeria cornellensis]
KAALAFYGGREVFEEVAVEAGSGGAKHDAVRGTNAPYVRTHIEALRKYRTFPKTHNKAETARSAPKKTGAAAVKSRSCFLWRA